MPVSPKQRLDGDAKSVRIPPRPMQSMTQYRALHGPRIRQYFSTGNPVGDIEAGKNRLRLVLISGALFFAILLIYFVLRRS